MIQPSRFTAWRWDAVNAGRTGERSSRADFWQDRWSESIRVPAGGAAVHANARGCLKLHVVVRDERRERIAEPVRTVVIETSRHTCWTKPLRLEVLNSRAGGRIMILRS